VSFAGGQADILNAIGRYRPLPDVRDTQTSKFKIYENSIVSLEIAFLAPFASVPVFTLACLGTSDAGVGSDFFWGIFLSILLAVPTSFVGILLIGVPVFLILRPYKYALMLASCGAGFAIPFLMFLGDPNSGMKWGAGASGIAVGAVAYCLRPRNA
jgi:hypothetical protein